MTHKTIEPPNLTDHVKAFSDINRSMTSLKHAAADAMRILSKMSAVPQTFQATDTLYILPYCEQDARLLLKAWKLLFPPAPKRPLIHNGGKPRRGA